ncbi:MAG: thiamine pyrophosphate-dependent enzyme [candidate division WOR-3 bacterium]|nr:thiamine pyrophosphate-dependent enzyme [candidate division WOR-3 bacterium]MCX7757822.1 thiamine pyrophosphate-dependent enzyme [candidate division WOR-3 bacterium]MDW7987099.1 thiamine pyrophosphate-dependent enzyme [candidate division WOR-3 bacterium]
MPSIKELSREPELFSSGHRACTGCGEVLAVRQVLLAATKPVACAMPTGCLEIVSTIYPHTAWQVPMFHSAFENAAATISGMEAAYRALKRKGKITEEINFIAFGGDGGTYDIGFQALSGAVERRHRFLYVCLDNEAYMNTGIQRSSATPLGAHTTTSPAGKVKPGKLEWRKDIVEIMIAHDIPYAAQATVWNWNDLANKVRKALSVNGPSFINVLVPCPLGWGYHSSQTITLSRLAVETCFWPLYECENHKYRLNYTPKEKLPITEWLKLQDRFRHLFREENKHLLNAFQEEVDRRWELLNRKIKCSQ